VSFDVAVVGAGIVGAATASELARRGVRVVLLDRGEVSSGTTGLGEGNVLVSDKDMGPELALTLAGLRMYDEIEDRFGELARIRRKGALIVHPEAETWEGEAARVERLRAAGVRCSLIGADEVRAREPELTGDLLGASFFPHDLQCAPRAIARALAREPGVEVRTGCAVSRVVVRGGRVAGVATLDGEIACGAAVLCAGVWTAPLAAAAGLVLPLEPRKGQLVQLSVPGGSPRFIRHKVVDGSYLRSVASAAPGLQVTTVLETTWDGDVLVGSSRERRGFDVSVDDGIGAAMVQRAARLMPRIAGLRRARAWAGLRPWLPDGLPAMGPSDAAEGLWVATGHEGAGVALGPITGRVVAAALCGERPELDLAAFRPDRFVAPAVPAAG
jgi:glycine/D-amino acid oxidase-like deaminating enzyme